MKKFVLTVLGQDRPGIIARISGALLQQECNIENVSQTTLQSEFAGIFIVTMPQSVASNGLSKEKLRQFLVDASADMHLHIHIKDLIQEGPTSECRSCEKFVITTRGPDRKGLVAAVTTILARHEVNVTNMQAVFKGGDDPNRNIMIYEVDVAAKTDYGALDADLREKATELGLIISIQHRRIFEAINRI